MRKVSSIKDVQIVINDFDNERNRNDNSNWNRKGYQIKNMGDAIDPQDAVTLRQLDSAIANIKFPDAVAPIQKPASQVALFHEGAAFNGLSLFSGNYLDVPGVVVTLDKAGFWQIDAWLQLVGDPAAQTCFGRISVENADISNGNYLVHYSQILGEIVTMSMGWVIDIGPAIIDVQVQAKASAPGSSANINTYGSKIRAIYIGA